MAVLRHEADVIDRIPDEAALKAELLAAIDVKRRSHRAGAVVDAVTEVDVINARIELKRAPAAVVERMQDLGPVEAPGLVAAGLTGEVIADLGITAPEARIAIECDGAARDRIIAIRLPVERGDFCRIISVADPNLLPFGGEVEALGDRGHFHAGYIVAFRGDIAGINEALVGQLRERTRAILLRQRFARVLAMVETCTEMEPRRSQHRRIDSANRSFPAGASEARVVDRLVENSALERPAVGFLVIGDEGDAEAAIFIELVGEFGALHERSELGSGHRLEARERIEIAGLNR